MLKRGCQIGQIFNFFKKMMPEIIKLMIANPHDNIGNLGPAMN